MSRETGLAFWLRYVEAAGGVWEEAGEWATVLLPPQLRDAFGLEEEVSVTDDPEVAQEEGAVLLIPGHPALDEAADRVLAEGDAGYGFLPWPHSALPTGENLLVRARERVIIEHGRLDAAGEPRPVYLPALGGGVLATYTLEDRFQEEMGAWVDARTGLLLPEAAARRADAGERLAEADTGHPILLPDWTGALRGLQELFARRAGRRGDELAQGAGGSRSRELTQVEAYYEAQLESLAARRAKAPPERQALLDRQAEATQSEKARRLQEIADKYRPRWELRPFRLHLVLVPAMLLPLVIRRGERRFSFALTWSLVGGVFASVRCPVCGRDAPLVAGRERLGCLECLPRAEAPVRPEETSRLVKANGRETAAAAEAEKGAGAPGKGQAPPQPTASVKPTAKPAKKSSASPPPPIRPGLGRDAKRQLEAKMFKAGDKLKFWEAALAGQTFSGVAPASPLESLYRLYGSLGPWVALGIAPAEVPAVKRVEGLQQAVFAGARLGCTTGYAWAGRIPHPFTLRWRYEGERAVPIELLPLCDHGRAGLPGRSDLDERVASRLYDLAPAPGSDLDPVAKAFWGRLGNFGLPFVLRCLTLWWRLPPGVVPAASPESIAAAVAHMVAQSGGVDGLMALAEARFGGAAAETRRVLTSLLRLVQPSGNLEPW